MRIQRSFEPHETGTVYIVPTPIGNLEDITYRALKVLQSVTVIAAEDTRNTKKLLHYFAIETPLTSYHEHNKETKEASLMAKVQAGESIAVVSDAGMPAISDPGYELVRAATRGDIPVVVLPGANAALCALAGSGLSTATFLFYGFLPRKKKEKENALAQLRQQRETLLFYESPFRVKDTLFVMQQVLGDRQITIARELTKRYEEYLRGSISEIMNMMEEQQLKGEFCIVVEGGTADANQQDPLWWGHFSVTDHVYYYVENNSMTAKDAIKQVAEDRHMAKRDVYQIFHVGKD